MLKNENIICLSDHYWDDFWYRKQHFMSRFAQNGNRVLYVEPTFSMVRKPPRDNAKNRIFKSLLEKVDNKIYKLKLPKALPKHTNPFISKLNYVRFAKIIDSTSKRIGMKNYILWIYRPEYYDVLEYFNYKKMVFDLTDDIAEYSGKKDNVYYWRSKSIKGLIIKSDEFIVTAKTLFEKYKDIAGDKISLIPNGYDPKLFNLKKIKLIPKDLKKINKPIIGFVGVLFNLLDYDLIYYISNQCKDCSIVLVGPIEKGTIENSIEKEIKKIRNVKNISILGYKDKNLIPFYIRSFDLCINPFKVNEASKSVNPLKVYEYLACGKPVISVKMESLQKERVSKVIDFANDYKDFVKRIKFWLENDSPEKEAERRIAVRYYSWDRLFLELNRRMKF